MKLNITNYKWKFWLLSLKFFYILFFLIFSEIYVFGQNSPPVALNDTVEIVALTWNNIHPLENDYDPEGQNIIIADIEYSLPSYSETSDNGEMISIKIQIFNQIQNGKIKYRVKEINNPELISDWAYIYIHVIPNPLFPYAVDDVSNEIGLTEINVLSNDNLSINDTIRGKQVYSRNGYVRFISDSVVQFEPYLSFYGVDSGYYTLHFMNDTFETVIFSDANIVFEIPNNHSYENLNINNISAGINSYGLLFSDLQIVNSAPNNVCGFSPSFEAPSGSGIHSIFTSNLWIGGLSYESNDTLHFAGERYKGEGGDYWYGPISNMYDEEYDKKYIKTWKLKDYQISRHINHFTDPGYIMDEAIETWPANGDVNNGQLSQMAPFEDKNGNGIYEPMQGDFPLIRGDEAVYFIFNDERTNHTESYGAKLGVEIHAMAYSFRGEIDSALANTVFVHYDIINRSDTTYYNTYFASFTDFDIGNPYNDYVGCDVRRGSFFAYDATAYDEDYIITPWDIILGYKDNLAAQSATIIAGPFMDYDGIDNPLNNCDESVNGLNFGNGITDDERFGMTRFISFSNSFGATGDPVIAPEYYNYMCGAFRDLSQVQYGGNGHEADTNTVGPACRFMFPGDSDPCNWGTNGIPPNEGFNQNGKFWTEKSMDNESGDRRGVGISGPFTFEPGDLQELDIAYVFARNYSSVRDTTAQKDILLQRIDSVIHLVHDKKILDFNEALEIDENYLNKQEVILFPNPLIADRFSVKIENNRNQIPFIIYNSKGIQIKRGYIRGGEVNQLSLEKEPRGVYYIKLLLESQPQTKAIIKL